MFYLLSTSINKDNEGPNNLFRLKPAKFNILRYELTMGLNIIKM